MIVTTPISGSEANGTFESDQIQGMNKTIYSKALAAALALILSSCVNSGTNEIDDLSAVETSAFLSRDRFQKGVIYKAPPHSEEAWCYYSRFGPEWIGWRLFLPQDGSLDTGVTELDRLKNHAEHWAEASNRVNGSPEKRRLLGTPWLGEEPVPIYEWQATKLEDPATVLYHYATVLPIKGSTTTIQLRVKSSEGTHLKLPLDRVIAVLRELTESKQWLKLYSKP